MIKVGIPKGLLFYRYFPLWETFFESLGVEVVVSVPTTDGLIRKGSRLLPGDLCLPMKIYFGHVESIKEEVDFLFVPRYISIEPEAYMCPKLIGLPDMVLSVTDSLPRLIDDPIDCRANGRDAERSFYLKAGKIFLKDNAKVERAYGLGLERQARFRSLLRKGFSFEEGVTFSRSTSDSEKREDEGRMRLGLIGRPYYTHDPYLRKLILEEVEKKGFQLLTNDILSDQEIESGVEKLRKRIYWSFGKELVGSAICLARDRSIRGIINLASFGCGQDSFNFEMIQHTIREEVPMLSLIFDEHLSSGGFSTRIEAFLEMIVRGVEKK
jgi:predicted nucleotide-binding protein (sugar kinase/HSP70/actin superfamily)